MGKYFVKENESNDYKDLFGTLRIRDIGDGFQLVKGGNIDNKGKLKQFDVMAYCETKEEAEALRAYKTAFFIVSGLLVGWIVISLFRIGFFKNKSGRLRNGRKAGKEGKKAHRR